MAYVGIPGCERMTRNLMDVHGLAGWSFKWDRAKARIGQCDHKRKRITLSRPIAELWGPAGMRDTALHEIAHALAGKEHGHDSTWKAICLRIGAVPERCADVADDAPLPPARYTGTCPNGHTHRRERLTPKALRATCGLCTRRYDPRYRITWQEN
jgi:predicted SprT family Zn-dependent metalloprotease